MFPDHQTMVSFAKSAGLFYLLILFASAVIYAYWPSNKSRFEKSANDILDEEDTPR